MHKTWSRAEQFRSAKESHEIFPTDGPAPRRLQFSTSFEKEQPSISLLLGWEYGRLWLKEHTEFVKKELSNAKAMFIDPDFNWWVNKRTVVKDRRQFYLKNKKNPHLKNCDLSAFSLTKNKRQKQNGTGSISGSQKQGKNEKENSNPNSNTNSNTNANSNSTPNSNPNWNPNMNPSSKTDTKENSMALSNTDSKSNAKTNKNSKANLSSDSKPKAKKCTCKDCIRRAGGQEITYGSYGPDNKKYFNVNRKILTLPWY